jgi:hypothetical protein
MTARPGTTPTPSFKFANDTTVADLITDNDETAQRERVRDLTVWCKDNLSINVIKTKEMIVDYWKKRMPKFSSTGLYWSRLRASSFLGSTSPTN